MPQQNEFLTTEANHMIVKTGTFQIDKDGLTPFDITQGVLTHPNIPSLFEISP